MTAMREMREGSTDGQGLDVLTGDYLAELAGARSLAHRRVRRRRRRPLARFADRGGRGCPREAAIMARYAAAEAACDAADRAVQVHGGDGITQEYGMAGLLVATRAGRIAPVSREMILNYVAMHSSGLPTSY
jgi:alkylation response protein AidB-like acyl-CoA dehydrogenase